MPPAGASLATGPSLELWFWVSCSTLRPSPTFSTASFWTFPALLAHSAQKAGFRRWARGLPRPIGDLCHQKSVA